MIDMIISKIEIKNFKSFQNISADLNDFNVIVGASAAGKSNFVEAFRFLKDIANDFENGVYAHGGILFQNLNCNKNTHSCIKVTLGDGKPFVSVSNIIERNNKKIVTKVCYTSIEYELCIKFNATNIDDIKETVKFNFNIYNNNSILLSKNTLYLKNDNGHISAEFDEEEKYADLEFFAPQSLLNIVNNNFQEKKGLIINSALAEIPTAWSKYFKEIGYYNFDPNIIKSGRDVSNTLSEYGANLSFVLNTILSDEDNKRKFNNLISIVLPYIKDIKVDKMGNEEWVFRLIESYSKLPIFAPFVSDGTANIIALISALYFSEKRVLLIEEPERNIHPALFIKLISMMKEVSTEKQLIITTHSPEILNYCDLNDIHLISRNDDGFSKVSKPIDNVELKEFIDEIGIGQVFVDGYLEFGNE